MNSLQVDFECGKRFQQTQSVEWSILQDKEIIKCGGTWGLTVQVRESRDQEVNLSGLQPFVLLWTSRAAQ